MSATTSHVGEMSTIGVGRARWLIVLPAVFIMYTISFFDRVNIGMALPHITPELGLTPVQAGWVGGSLAWGYAITQLAGGFLALKFGSRRLIGLCLVLFGATAIATGLVRNFWELVAVRFLLGLFEGPIYAATSMFLAQWFVKSERGRAFGIWNLSLGIGGFLAGPISGALLSAYDWRLTMVVEGVPAWIFCAVWFMSIPKSIDAASWLSEADRKLIKDELAAEQAAHSTSISEPWWRIFSEPAVWLMTAGFGLNSVLLYGFTLWLPAILKSYGTLSEFMVGLYAGAPFLTTMLGILYITNRSDKHGQERRWHAAVPTMLTGMLMIGAAFIPVHLYAVQIAAFIIIGFLMKMLVPLIFARLTEILPLSKAVPAVAFVSGVGNLLGQFFGPLIIGYAKSISPTFTLSLVIIGICSVAGGICVALSRSRTVAST
ncbi:MFS transporter [Bradyrhizobium sp. Cp5.3]|uniref:MFS transporter n=1 Tax=Bradyrhizobium sp. Cp5.3 TaxID=443598 RepID=UPI000420833F|nr:MFS transporter [Bradyrhizobium sp. Cp5.3]